jgi:PAS domain S-box-containing protein
MKILYLANDRRGANAAAAALRGVVSDVVLTLVDRPEDARRWIDANRDFAALILDIDPQASERRALVHDLRSIGVTVPIIAACAGDPSVIRPFTGLADAIVTRDVTFGEQLSRAVRRLLMIEGPPPRRRLRLLYLGDDSLARECLGRPGGSIEVIADSDPDDRIESALLDGALTTAPCDLLLIEHGRPGVDTLAVLRGVAARYPGLPVVIVADWDEQLAVRALQLGASDYVLKSRASFRAVYFRLHRLIAQSGPVEEQTRLRGRRAAAIDRDSGNQDDLMRRVADAEAARQNADEQLTAAIAAVRQSRKDRLADAVAAARELAQRESRFAARLADALAEAQHLRERLSSQDMLLKQQEERAGRQHRALSELFARRQADADAALNNEVALRRTLERRLAEAEGSLQTSEEQRRAGQSAAAESLAQQHAEFTARLAQITTARETVERRLNEALAAIAEAQAGRAADAAAAAEHLARRESELAARISRAATEQEQLERRLIDADAALRCAEQRMAAELHAARLIATEREAEFDAERLVLVASHDAVKGQLADLRRALEDAEQRRAADRTEAERRLNEAQDRHHAALAEAAGRHDGLQQQLAAADAHLQRVLAGHASEIAEAGVRLATMQGAADARATQLVTAVASLERQLSDAVAALGRLEDQTAAEREAARLDAALRQRDFEAAIASEITNREAVERALTQSEADRQEAARAHVSAIADAAARHTALEFDLTRKSGQLAALEATLAQSESTRDNEAQQHASAIAAAGARLADHQQQTDGWLADAAALADALDERRQLLEAALARSEDERARDRQSAREDAVQQQTEYEARLAEEVSLREAREAQLRETETALQEAERRHLEQMTAVAAESASYRAEAAARLAEEVSVREAREAQLRETETALQEAERRHLEQMTAVAAESALHRRQADAQMAQLAAGAAAALEAAEQEGLRRQRTAADESAARERDLEAEIARHAAHGKALTRALADAEATRLRDDAQYASRLESAGEALAAAHREKDELMAQLAAARDHGDQLERLATEAQAAWQRLDADAQERILRLQDEGDALRSSLREAGEQLQQRDHAHQEERAGMERARLALEADLARGRAEYAALETALEQTRSAAEDTLARLSTERAQERSTFEALVRERDAELRDRAARQQSSEERAAAALTALEHRLQLAAETHRVDAATIAQLQQSSAALTRNLEQVNRERDVLNLQADRVPELERQLNALHAQQRRQFVETPMSMCRCRPDGAVTHVNQALARLLGYATPDAVPTRDFGEAIFDTKDELPWLLNRCLASRATQSIETTWKKRDGRRIVVRVFALPVAAGAIDLVAEDVTRVRALEEQLRNAQRMEAVARYGSEVAATCGSLLRHVKQEGQEWLARVESDTTRYQGELLFHEVTRAAGFLEHFAAYGNEEKDAPVLVDVTTLLRDLAPVLRRVAGDNIELVVSQPHTPLNLDVEAKRVERMLINVAAYGRERMPFGGRLKIEVASVVVNREFVARYPNVRPGAHVLLTVSEVRAVPRRDLPDTVESAPAVAASQSRPADNPGVDLGTLQTLVSDCGGHLWMMAEPSGNMVLKIHVPRRVLDRAEPALQPVRSRWIHRAFGARH